VEAATMKSTKSVATKVSPLQAGQAVPLDQVSITWHRESYFVGEDKPQPITITGVELAAVLEWMAKEAPGRPTNFGSAEYMARSIRGIGRLCQRLAASSTFGDYPGEDAETLDVLGEVLVDYATRALLAGKDEKEHTLSRLKATITLAAPAEASKAVA
jgi:hypothetical protein